MGSLIELLERRAGDARGGYFFLQNGRDIGTALDYAALAAHARAIAAELHRHTAAGDRALLLYPAGLSFLPALFGSLYANVIAVPAPLTDAARLKRTLPRLQAIVADAQPAVVLTSAATFAGLRESTGDLLANVPWIATDEPGSFDQTAGPVSRADPSTIAYLQYTSGSTATPRGVMVTHGNVLQNLKYLRSALAYDEGSVSVTWLPHFHDFGLVEGLFSPLYNNIPCYVLSPVAVLKRPLVWLQAIDRHRGTHSHAPNFAYEMCLDRVTPAQRDTLDLSSWCVAANGAEPIRSATVRRFQEFFSPCGFRRDAMSPAYGLAEATLLVTIKRHGREAAALTLDASALEHDRVALVPDTSPDVAPRRVVGCGTPQTSTQVLIVDPATRCRVAPDVVGEIWIADRSVAAGYWRRPDDTTRTFEARLFDEPSAGPFLRTGDLGFIREGDLYVTGRLKDLIIIGGHNHYPQDIEWTVQSECPELRRDHCVAFSIEGTGTEALVVVAEPERVKAEWGAVLARMREAIVARHDISPSAIVIAERGAIQKTSSGKLQRRTCRQAFLEARLQSLARWDARVAPEPAPARLSFTGDALQRMLCETLADVLAIKANEIDLDAPFAALGLHSRAALAWVASLEEHLGGCELHPALLWQYPNIAALSAHLGGMSVPRELAPEPLRRFEAGPVAAGSDSSEAIAIVGLACRFPGVANADEFWSLLEEGRGAITRSARFPGVEAGFLADIDDFDHEFFGLTASEARAMDPQQRLLLEVAWEALENAGMRPADARARGVGVFVGISAADHLVQLATRATAADELSAYTGTGMAASIAANRLSYQLNLSGPSLAIDTACSSSLVAVHHAVASLLRGECDAALAGGVNVIGSPFIHTALQRAGMLSPTGRCHTFDAAADGYVRGEGCGLLVLKRLSDARRDGDTVVCVIRGSAVNQDGRSNGLTAPNPAAQESVIREALASARLDPTTVDFVEAHGSGTPLGDPIEVGALHAVYGASRSVGSRCWIGSVKTNVGHLEAAAGIAGLIKAILALEHAAVPANLHLRTVNPLLRLEGTPFAVPTRTEAWPVATGPSRPRRAAVSSFGFGGTNAHVVLERHVSDPEVVESSSELRQRGAHLFTLSARNAEALSELAARYANHLGRSPEPRLADLCFTMGTGRVHQPERLAVPAAGIAELKTRLDEFAGARASSRIKRGRAPAQRPGLVFLFTGQGSQYPAMARQLYETHEEFRRVLEHCDAVLRDELPHPLLSVLFGEQQELIDQTAYAQPALFAVEYGVARLLQDWGLQPAAVAGHSFGELVAACIAGMFALDEGLRLVTARGRLIQSLPQQEGALLAVLAPEGYVRDAIRDCGEDVSVAAVNAPRNILVSGLRTEIARLRERFEHDGVTCRDMRMSHALHSRLMDPILPEFRRVATAIRYAPPAIPFVSNLLGERLHTAPDAAYWSRHIRETVRFADGIASLGREHRIFLEIGPKPVLSALAAQCLGNADAQYIPTLKPGGDDWESLLHAVARLYVAGVTPDFDAIDRGFDRRRVRGLPTYSFQRSPLSPTGAASPSPSSSAESIASWGYAPAWVASTPEDVSPDGTWWLLEDAHGVGTALQALMVRDSNLHPRLCTDSIQLADAINAASHESGPVHVVCCWPLDWPSAESIDPAGMRRELETRLDPILALVRQAALGSARRIDLWLVTRAAVAVDEERGPGTLDGLLQSVMWGFGRSLSAEYPDLRLRLIDVSGDARESAHQLWRECQAGGADLHVCYRSNARYVSRLTPWPLPPVPDDERLDGAWLITGGLGELGLHTAEVLASRGVRHLMLLGRRGAGADATERIDRLRGEGREVHVVSTDVTDPDALRRAVRDAAAGWQIEGIVHAAGIVDDGVLHKHTAARFVDGLSAKMIGAWNLHLLSRDLPIRHFVLFSSAVSLLGNPGQTSYAAGNAFLDALAHYRRARGLPALAVNWGAWAGVAGTPGLVRRLESRGLRLIAPAEGRAALERLLFIDVPQVAVLPTRGGALSDAMLPTDVAVPRVDLREYLIRSLADILGRTPDTVDPARPFFDQGVDSLGIVELRNRLQRYLDRPVPIALAFDYPTVDSLCTKLAEDTTSSVSAAFRAPKLEDHPDHPDAVAIVSMACRFPGSTDSPEAFWALLRDGVDAISEVPSNRWDARAYYDPDPAQPGTIVTRHGGFVDGVDLFDAPFFGISATEAKHLDPQQRMLLEVCWEALERAGIPPSRLAGTDTGVFIGISTNDYLQRLNRRRDEIDAYVASGNALSLAANRLSYVFGFEGPSVAVDTACSSSLVAIHQACRSLVDGEAEVAVAGGVNLLLDPTVSINHSRARMLAPDGRCKAFSASADGMSRSEGCGLVLLKRLADAIRDRDPVLAVIRGSATNQDGRTSGLTVPNGRAQQRVIRRALEKAGVEPAAIDYVEAHGTGTPLGDPIEASALSAVFGGRQRPLLVGSVKTNIGHLESAAGVAGLMKVVLALNGGAVPPHLHCESLNPEIDWARSPIRITSATTAWPRGAVTRRAGVSSFGFGGTNAHVIVEESPVRRERQLRPEPPYVLPISAKSATALRTLVARVVEYLDASTEDAADICYTAAIGRDHFTQRVAAVGANTEELRLRLAAWLLDGTPPDRVPPDSLSLSPDGAPNPHKDVASVYGRGLSPDWGSLYAGFDLRRVVMPGHPFERQSYFVESTMLPVHDHEWYRVEWERPQIDPPSSARPPGRWLVLSDRQGWGEMVAAVLERRGAACTIAPAAAALDLRAIVARCGALDGIVHFGALDSSFAWDLGVEALVTLQRRNLGMVFDLARAVAALAPPPRVWVCTQAAQHVAAGDRLDGLAQAPVWGAGRTLPLELPLWAGLLDLPLGGATMERVEKICNLIAGAETETQWAFRSGRFYSPRLRRWRPGQRRSSDIAPDRSYLITGGFGTLGQTFGRWLAARGARSLWVVGRRGADDSGRRAYLADLEASGVAVRSATLDVAEPGALAAQIGEWQRACAPLAGVIHAAGANAQTAVPDIDGPDIDRALAAKVAGAWAVHLATAGLPLDFFVLCSSIAGVWGGRLQAAYSAANAFLDGLAAHRQALGLPAVSVAMGPLAGSAMLGEGTAATLAKSGIQPTPLAEVPEDVFRLLRDGAPHGVSAAIDWARFIPLYGSRTPTGFFADLVETAPALASASGTMASAAASSPQSSLEWLTAQLCALLGLRPDQLDPAASLPRLGLDSLMAVDLRNRLRQQRGIDLPLAQLLGELSLSDIASRITGAMTAPAGWSGAEVGAAWVSGEI